MTASHFTAPVIRGLAALALLSALPALQAQNAALTTGGRFLVDQGGNHVGTAQYSGSPVEGGYALRSSGEMKLGSFSYKFDNQATVDSALNFVRDTLTGSVNGTSAHVNNITFAAASDATGRNITMQITGDGEPKTNEVDRHRNLVMVPDLDPAAYTLMVEQGLAQPTTAWVLIPKETGLLVPAEYKLAADVRGTVGGSAVTVKHLTATIGAENALTLDLFASPSGELLEADLDQQNIHVVREGFVLLERPKPAVPAQAAPPPGADGQGGQQQPPQGYGAPQPPAPPQPPVPPQS